VGRHHKESSAEQDRKDFQGEAGSGLCLPGIHGQSHEESRRES